MGCFCRHVIVPPIPVRDEGPDEEPADEPTAPPVIAAVSAALSARWLPAQTPWEPDPEWLEVEPPPVPMSPAALATIIRLVHARLTILLALELDPLEPPHQKQLARIVATLNRRSRELAPLAEDPRPWSALALLNGQLDVVQHALAQNLLEPDPVEAPLGPWKPLIAKVRPLLPVLAVVEMLKLDVRDPVTALDTLTVTIRKLRKVVLPPLAKPHLIMQLIARNDAVQRLETSLGPMPFQELREKVVRKLQEVQEQLPQELKVGKTGVLEGLPELVPNPSLIINPPTIAAVRQLDPAFVAGLNWNISIQLDAPLLTVGVPVATLVKSGVGTVRRSPCDGRCDAAQALATALPDSHNSP